MDSLEDQIEVEILEDENLPDESVISKFSKEKITNPVMTTNEKTVIISQRINQLDRGYKSTISKPELRELKIYSSYDIAMLEFERAQLPPYHVKRNLPNGTYELWSHTDFQYFP